MKIQFFPICLIFILPHVLPAQDELSTIDNNNFESWNALEINYAPTEKLSMGLEAQLRLKSLGDTYNMSFLQLQAQITKQPFLLDGCCNLFVDGSIENEIKANGTNNWYHFSGYHFVEHL